MFQCVCTYPINSMGIHFLHYTHGNEHTRAHVVVRDTFVAIARDFGFHVGWKQLHVLLSTMFNSFCWWVDIVFTKDDIHTLINVVIVDPSRMDLLPWLCNSRICCLWCGSNQRKELLWLTPHWLIPPISNWGIWMFTQKSWCAFTWLCQCHLEFKRTRRPSSSCLGYFS
jgi:hypothetical protein